MMMIKKNVMLTFALGSVGLLWAACGDDDNDTGGRDAGEQVKDAGSENDSGDENDQDADVGADGGGDASAPEVEPVYAITTQVFGESDQVSYLIKHEGDLFEGDISRESDGTRERAGRALVVAGIEPGTVYYAGDKLGEVDRYDLKDDSFELGDTVSFSGEGVAAIAEYPGQLVMVGKTKALYFDARTLKVIVWNPEDMTLTRAIDVTALKVDGFAATFSTVTAIKGDKVYMPVGYRTPAAVPSNAAVLVVDTKNDTAKVVKDSRCGYVRDAVEGDDGAWYLATEAFGSAVHYLNETAAPAPCLLRFDFDSDSYDASFKVDLNELADGKTVGSIVKLPNGKFYTRVLDVSKVPVMAMPSGRGVASARAWGWSEITLGDSPELKAVSDAFVMGGSLIPMQLGDKLVIPDFSEKLEKTTLCDMSDGPYCDKSTEVEGLVFSVALLK